MTGAIIAATSLVLAALAASPCAVVAQPASLDRVLEPIRSQHRRLPTLVAAVVQGGRTVACGEALFHGGSAGTFMTAIWLAPKKDFAVVVCANLGGEGAQAAVDEAVGALIKQYLDEQ